MPRAKCSDDDLKRGLRLMYRIADICRKLDDDKSLAVMLYTIEQTEALIAGKPSKLSREEIQRQMNRGMH